MRSMKIVSFVLVALAGLAPLAAHAQRKDPLIGSWNITGQSGNLPFIVVMTFNSGGTTVEFDTAGTNSSASPGESIALGKWTSTGPMGYTFKEENYVYDASGNLFGLSVGNCRLTLGSSLNTFTGKCTGKIFGCNVTVCPNRSVVIVQPPGTINGTRF